MKKQNKLPSLSRVTPGSTATLELPIGATYERIIFDATAGAGLDATDITRIEAFINGQSIQKFGGLQRLMDINSYYGRESDSMSATAAQFALHFSRAELDSLLWREAPGIGTEDVETFHIEIDIASGAPADLKIEAHALINPTRQKLGAFMRIRELPFNSSVAGVVEVDKLLKGPWYSAIHLFKSDVSKVEITADDVKLVDATKGVLERFQKGASPKARVPVTAKATHVDFVINGNLGESIPTAKVQDWRLKMTLTTSGAVDIVTETIDTLAQ